jgi:hypothetical protein
MVARVFLEGDNVWSEKRATQRSEASHRVASRRFAQKVQIDGPLPADTPNGMSVPQLPGQTIKFSNVWTFEQLVCGFVS